MKSAPKLSVERAVSTVVILGECPIAQELASAFAHKQVGLTSSVENADYCLVWGEVSVPANFSGRIVYLHPYQAWISQSNNQGSSHIRHIYLGSLLGKDIQEPLLSEYYLEGRGASRISLPNDGVGKHYLLSVKDAVSGIVTSTVHPRAESQIYLLGIEYSLLSLAYHLRQQLSGHIDVIFSDEKTWLEPQIPQEQVAKGLESISFKPTQDDQDLTDYLGWLITTSPTHPPVKKLTPFIPNPGLTPQKLERMTTSRAVVEKGSGIKAIVKLFSPSKKSKPVKFEPIIAPTPPKLSRFKVKKIILPRFRLPRGVSNILIILAIGSFLYLSSLFIAALTLGASLNSLKNSLSSGGTPNLQLGQMSAGYLKMNTVALNSIPGLSSQTNDLVKLADVVDQLFPLAQDAFLLKGQAESLTKYIFGENANSSDALSSLNQARLLTESIYDQLSLIQGTLPTSLPKIFPASFAAKYDSSKDKLLTIKKTTLTGKAILSILPDIIGLGDRRKYALLLQNNMELRPTGGFIGSFALPAFDNGRLSDLPVYDVYQADGQLKGFVEPPLPIKKYLGEATWYLRDSNWDPDFPTTAGRVSWYLKKTLNQDVDGVIGINLSVIERLLEELGPIKVPEYEEEITKSNLYARTQYHAEIGFFPGSTQKKEFLSALVETMMARIRTLDTKTMLALGNSLMQSVDEQDISLYLTDANSQAIIHRLGWDGQIKQTEDDYLGIVDANVGVNKANYFLKRKLALQLDLDQKGNVTHTLTIDQVNLAESSAWPAGPYKNYQRLYLPAESELISLTKDGIEIAAKDIDTSIEHNKTVIGYLVTTPISGKSQVVATYRLGGVSQSNNPSYSLYWQKQPGTTNDPLTITLNYPLFLNPEIISPAADLRPQQLIFNLDNSSDRRILVNFTSK